VGTAHDANLPPETMLGAVPAGENVGQVKASSYQAQELQEQ
jgi:hypothetical protein